MAAVASFQCTGAVEHDLMGPHSQPAFHRLRLWGLALGPASPCADCHGAGTLRLTVSGVFTLICAYSFRHPHFSSLHPKVCHRGFTARRTLPYPSSRKTKAKLRRAA